MTTFSSLLVALDDPSSESEGVTCATWLAQQLRARLHVLPSGNLERAIVDATIRHDVALVVLSARDASLEHGLIGRCALPTLLLPPGYREALPWRRLVVPVSGTRADGDALSLALQAAGALDLTVRVLHVCDPNAADEGLEVRTRYADALHHEYPGQLDELVGGALALFPPKERHRIQTVSLTTGDVLDQLLEMIAAEASSVVVVGWRGNLTTGRAAVLRGLIAHITSPLLLVRESPRPTSHLEIGEELDRP